jgi:hypothetical protein
VERKGGGVLFILEELRIELTNAKFELFNVTEEEVTLLAHVRELLAQSMLFAHVVILHC